MEHYDTSSRLEDLVREMRRLVLDSQEYFRRKTRSYVDQAAHQKREQRIIEIKDELAKMLKTRGVVIPGVR
ncbi:MAG: hypothetical protein WB660_11170 [Candidatus Sulfotelmatobacter sp.]